MYRRPNEKFRKRGRTTFRKNISVAIVQRDTLIRPELHLFPFSLCFDNSRECGILHRQRLQRRRCIARNAPTPSRISFFLPLSRHGCAYIREKWRRQVLNLVVGVVPSVLPSLSLSPSSLSFFLSFSLRARLHGAAHNTRRDSSFYTWSG